MRTIAVHDGHSPGGTKLATVNYIVDVTNANTQYRAYNQANTATILAQAAFNKANTQSNQTFTQAAFDTANSAQANIVIINGVNVTQNAAVFATDGKMQSAYNQANTGTVLAQASYNQANVTIGVDVTQNNRITVIESTNVSQNARLDYSNSTITIIQGVDTTQNTAIAATDGKMQSGYNQANTGTVLAQAAFNTANNVFPQIQPSFNVANSASANTIIIQGVDVTQNTRLTVIEGTNLSQNVRLDYSNSAITILQGVNTTQNTRLTVIENTDLSQNVRIDYSNAAITIIQGVNTSQNVAIDATNQYSYSAFSTANNAYNQSNTGTVLAQAAFNFANTSSNSITVFAQAGYNQANVTIGVDATQNTRMTIIEGTDVSQNTRLTIIEGTNVSQNTAITATDSKMQSGYNQANTGLVLAQASFDYANSRQNIQTSASPTFNGLTLTNALAIAQGGTGATSSAAALTSLLPTGTTSGYVLTTGGPGTFYWAAGGGGGSGATPGTTIASTRISTTGNGSGLAYSTPVYTAGASQLRVYINGVRQFASEYTETSGNTAGSGIVTFSTSPASGSAILFEVDGYIVNPYYANNITFTAPQGTIPSTANTIQLAIQDLESRKATLASPSFTGLATATTVDTNASNTAIATTAFVKNALNNSNTYTMSVSGNAGTVTNGFYTSSSFNLGTTSVAVNRSSASQSLTGINIDGNAGTVTDGFYTTSSFNLGTTSIAVNRASASQSLTGINIDGSAATFTSTTQNSQFNSLGVGTAASATAGEIRATNEVTAYYSSDETLKENIQTIHDALGKLKQLRGVMFDWKDSYIQKRGGEDGYFVRKHDTGVIAQEVEKVLPEVVAERLDGTKAVKYEKLAGLIIQSIVELSEQVEQIKDKLK